MHPASATAAPRVLAPSFAQGWARAWCVRAVAAVGLAAVASGCGISPPPVTVTEVTPASVYQGTDSRITVRGEGFWPGLDIEAGAGGSSSIDERFRLVLRGDDGAATVLSGVAWQDVGTLVATVPAGLSTGVYDVEVTLPRGDGAVGVDLLTVRDTRVDRLRVDLEAVSYEVFEPVVITVRAVGPEGEPVAEDVPVSLRFTSEAGGPPAMVVDDDATPEFAEVGGALVGQLGADGVATVAFTVEAPDLLTISVAASDGSVPGDDVQLLVTPSSQLRTRIELPADLAAVAGDSFQARLTLTDAFGTPVTTASRVVTLRDTCGSWSSAVLVPGTATVTVTPTRATGVAFCPQMQLETTAGAPDGSSEPFEVAAGPLVRFDVGLAEVGPFAAGDSVTVSFTPVDAYGNLAVWASQAVTVDTFEDADDDGVPDGPTGGVAASACTLGGVRLCGVRLRKAASLQRLSITDISGINGATGRFDVVPGLPAGLRLDADTLAWTAGEPVRVTVNVEDAYGNAISPADAALALGDAGIEVSDPRDEVTCAAPSPLVRDCALTTAATTSVTVRAPAVPLTRRLDGVIVSNGPLAAVEVTLAPGPYVAGAPFDVTVAGRDAFGNAVTTLAGATVDLADATATLSPASATLGADGSTSAAARVRRAGVTAVTATLHGVSGVSAPFTVVAGPATRLDVALDQPWAFVGATTEVLVQALDDDGNRAETSGAVSLASRAGAAAPVSGNLVNGVGVFNVVWSAPALSDVLDASLTASPTVAGDSGPVAVASDCTDGPVADVSFAGSDFGLVCVDAAGEGSVTASLVGSAATPGQSLSRWGLVVDGVGVLGATPSVTVPLAGGPGARDARAFVAQADGCGAEVAAVVYAGPDDGTVVGPVALMSSGALVAGQTGVASLGVVAATTCRRAPAAGALLHVRTDLGELVGPSPTGRGLALTLDPSGSASFGLDASTTPSGGFARVVAWSDDAGGGDVLVPISGDASSPVVWSQSPQGAFVVPVDEVRVVFSEAMDDRTLSPASVALLGAGAPAVTDVVLDVDGVTATVSLAGPVAPGTSWTLQLLPAVTDVAGNGLAGTWGALPAAYRGAFGQAGQVDGVGACSRDRDAFSPDGDDAAGIEADTVTLSFSSPTAPAWWVVSVRDEVGTVVRQTHLPPAGAVDAWVWDGRDQDGRVVPGGTYTLRVEPEGNLGNRGSSCTRSVDVSLPEVP